MEFTKQELEWLARTKKERYKMGNLADAMNERARSYAWLRIEGGDIVKQVYADFSPFHDTSNIVEENGVFTELSPV